MAFGLYMVQSAAQSSGYTWVAPSPISTSPSPSSSSNYRWKAVPDSPPPPPPPPKDEGKLYTSSNTNSPVVGSSSRSIPNTPSSFNYIRPLPPPPPPRHQYQQPSTPIFNFTPQSHDRYRSTHEFTSFDRSNSSSSSSRNHSSGHRPAIAPPQVQEEVELEYLNRKKKGGYNTNQRPHHNGTDRMGRYEENEEGTGMDERERLVRDNDRESETGEVTTQARRYLGGLSRRAFGIALLLLVVTLWVTSSFLVSHIFTDDNYVKPYLVVYLSTSSFTIYLIPWGVKHFFKNPNVRRWLRLEPLRGGKSRLDTRYSRLDGSQEDDYEDELGDPHAGKLGPRDTMKLSAQFCLLWFVANWFAGACLEYTSVASTTILSATSSIFTLIFGALFQVERFSWAKVGAIAVSMTGVVLISKADATKGSATEEPPTTGGEKHHTTAEILLGDGMALLGALIYGLYTVLLKVRIGHESRVSMQLFFGFVGLFNFLCLWPGLIILHYTGHEKFELPPTRGVWWILAINCSITVVSDFCWVFAMMYTTPVIVTVGLSLSIPLALLGDILISSLKLSWTYWVGACLVFGAFFVVNSSVKDEELLEVQGIAAAAGAGSAAAMDPEGDAVESDEDRRRSRVFERP
ncbi:hypothetical protein H072_3573 [Dactylellina haptotyla CBS 200.50]|uniref:EamA domain-containing protein n=1 Tax=Dactylellina haptotyla (strain CBS 200.50) TaxID=1284197 RepID=S8AHD1_DACHA|nr:hypothetical protein H072_3573 [Dactylellina haptotyla CBS 200.50]